MDLNDDWKLSKNEVTAGLVLLIIALDFDEEWIEQIDDFFFFFFWLKIKTLVLAGRKDQSLT